MTRFLYRWYQRIWHNVDPERDEAERAQVMREARLLDAQIRSETFRQEALDKLARLAPKFIDDPNVSPRVKLAVALFGALMPVILARHARRWRR